MEGIWKIVIYIVIGLAVFAVIKDSTKFKEHPIDSTVDAAKDVGEKGKDIYQKYTDNRATQPVNDNTSTTVDYGRPRCNNDEDCYEFSQTAYCANNGNCYEQI